MYDLTASEKANKSALILVHDKYSTNLAPFVKSSKTRYAYVSDEIEKIIEDVCKETGADPEWVRERFSALNTVLEKDNAKSEKLDSKPTGPYTTNSDATTGLEGIKNDDVADRGEVVGLGREEALKADATQDLSEETTEGETEVDNKTAAALKEAMTARDFRLIAGILASIGADEQTVTAFARELAQTNPLFDIDRFMAAAQGSPMSGRDAPGYGRGYTSSCFRCGNEFESVKESKVCMECNHSLLKLALPQPDGTDPSMGLGVGAEGPGVQELPNPVNPNVPYACKLCKREFPSREEVLGHVHTDHADVLQRQQEQQAPQNMGQDNLGVTAPLASTKEAEILWPDCPNCGKVAGFHPYPYARGHLECNNCRHLVTPEALASRYNEMNLMHGLEMQSLPETEHPLGPNFGGKTADVPQPTDEAAEVQPLPQNPGDMFDKYVQKMAETAAARKFSMLSDEDIHSIASQTGNAPDDVKNNVKAVAVFGDQTGVNGELGGDPTPPEGYTEISAQGLTGQQDTHEALVPTDLIIQAVANDLNMSPELAYNQVKDKYGADLDDKYHASISGQVHYYLPAEMAQAAQQQQQQQMQQQQQQQMPPAATPPPQMQPQQPNQQTM